MRVSSNAKVGKGSQPPLVFDLSLTEWYLHFGHVARSSVKIGVTTLRSPIMGTKKDRALRGVNCL
jgi:hypothetical protein